MLKNIFANIFGRLWGTVSNFLFIPLYIKYLGFDSFSIISFTLVIAGFMMIFGAGVTATLSREFARSDYSRAEKIQVFDTLEVTYFILILFCGTIVFFLSNHIANDWISVPKYKPEEISCYIKIIAIDVGFQLLIKLYMGGMLGLEKHVKANAYQIGWGVFRNGLVVVVIALNPKLEYFFMWQCIASIIFAILLRVSLSKMFLGGKFHINFKFDFLIIKRIWRFSTGLFFIALIAGVNTQLDKLIIGLYLPIEELGYYTLSVSLAMGLVVIVNPISSALLPRFTSLYTSNKTKDAAKIFNTVSLYVSVLIFSFMSNMIFNAENLLWVWTGNIVISEHSSSYLPVIAVSMAMLSLQVMPYSIAIANGYTKINTTLGLCSLFITIPGYWFVIKEHGAMGAAVVFCVVQVITTFLYLYFIQKKFLRERRVFYSYIKLIFLPLFATLILGYVFSLISYSFEIGRVYTLISIGLCSLFTLFFSMLILDYVGVKRCVVRFWKHFVHSDYSR
ncbi:oligosaccharide flippase family protein [Shewanella xiamenensis]|uniref:oligosaccharide flippase family protein n=1 Tax=Shewanella xiamenensis TaxID=332186 RepID=UPI0035B858CF